MHKTALLVIDMQKAFELEKRWNTIGIWPANIKERVNNLVNGVRKYNVPVFWIAHSDYLVPQEFAYFRPDYDNGKGIEIMDDMDRQDNDYYLTKNTRNAFTSSGLAPMLTELGITTVGVCGIQTEQCVISTAFAAGELRFTSLLITDATATYPLKYWDEDYTMTPREIIKSAEAMIHGRAANIMSSADFITYCAQDSDQSQ